MSDFTFAGVHSTVNHVRLLKSPVSILPGTRDKVITLPGRHGALRMLPDLGERSLQLDLWLAADNIEQLYSRLDAVRAWLNPLRGQQQLIFDRVPDRYYLATVTGVLDAEIVAKQGRFEAELSCPDPFAYAVNPDVVTITASPHQHNKRGTAPADPLLRLQGVSTGAGGQELKLAVGVQSITYRGALAIGEWIEIDCAAKTVNRVIGTTRSNALPFVAKPIFPQLSPGENQISVIAEGGATWSLLEIRCRNRWL